MILLPQFYFYDVSFRYNLVLVVFFSVLNFMFTFSLCSFSYSKHFNGFTAVQSTQGYSMAGKMRAVFHRMETQPFDILTAEGFKLVWQG